MHSITLISVQNLKIVKVAVIGQNEQTFQIGYGLAIIQTQYMILALSMPFGNMYYVIKMDLRLCQTR